jgi:hypothetical protein
VKAGDRRRDNNSDIGESIALAPGASTKRDSAEPFVIKSNAATLI